VREDPFGGGVVDLLVLSVLERGESYGYAITQALADGGVAALNEATVYACLRRLHDRGHLASRQVVAENGKARRYYSLTKQGDAHRRSEEASWRATSAAVDRILAATGGGT
jgi:PadR family transcriptional regulator PadR